MPKTLEDWIVSVLVQILRLPPAARRIPRSEGLTLFVGKRYNAWRTVQRNLNLALGKTYSAAEIDRLRHDVFRYMGRFLAEFVNLPQLEGFPQRQIELANIEALEEALAQKRGVLLVTGHFGNWELGASALSLYGYPLSSYARKQDSPKMERLIASLRAYSRIEYIHQDGPLRELFRHLKRSRIVTMLPDQYHHGRRSYVDFFNLPVSAGSLAVRFAKKSGASVVFVDIIAQPEPFHYRLRFHEADPPPLSGNPHWDHLAHVQKIMHLLEDAIRQAPEQYLWQHRIFRPIPPKLDLNPLNLAFLQAQGTRFLPEDAHRLPAAQAALKEHIALKEHAERIERRPPKGA